MQTYFRIPIGCPNDITQVSPLNRQSGEGLQDKGEGVAMSSLLTAEQLPAQSFDYYCNYCHQSPGGRDSYSTANNNYQHREQKADDERERVRVAPSLILWHKCLYIIIHYCTCTRGPARTRTHTRAHTCTHSSCAFRHTFQCIWQRFQRVRCL